MLAQVIARNPVMDILGEAIDEMTAEGVLYAEREANQIFNFLH
ncbi:MAG: hypothetical protein ACI8PW_000068 [Methylophilaceae bacterium]|jgi:hypothetical protein